MRDYWSTNYSRFQVLTEGRPAWAQGDRGTVVLLRRPAFLAAHAGRQAAGSWHPGSLHPMGGSTNRSARVGCAAVEPVQHQVA